MVSQMETTRGTALYATVREKEKERERMRKNEREKEGCSTVVLRFYCSYIIGFTCPAITVGTGRERERARVD